MNQLIKEKKNLAVVYTNEAACKDCYRCIRACPVNAIRMVNDQAQVINEKCIACGLCINECPQDAKMYRKDFEKVSFFIKNKTPIAFSIAPSFASIFEEWQYKRLPSALRELGAFYVGETAIGAAISAKETALYIQNNPNKTQICSACPAVITYIEKYDTEKIASIIPVVSPMIAHAKKIKQDHGANCKVIFVGPCIAKKDEADRKELKGLVSVVLTFEELFILLEQHNIQINNCEESSFDELPPKDARTFPLEGGLLRTAKISTDMLNKDVISVSGVEALRQVLNSLDTQTNPVVIEPLYCKHGCINGPISNKEINSYKSRSKILHYASQDTGTEEIKYTIDPVTHYSFAAKIQKQVFSKEAIEEILAKTGKSDPSNQLNCRACGYDSCLDQAQAVLEDIAVPEMCIPYMRRIAEQKNDLILETDPNGVIILDDKLNIISMNPAFRKMFYCSDMIIGKRISKLLDPEIFEQISIKKGGVIRKTIKYPQYNLICHQTHYYIKESGQTIGIFDNITESQKSQGELKKIKVDTVIQAQELIDHQITMAQEMASFLGESVSKGEMLMNKLISSIDNKGDE